MTGILASALAVALLGTALVGAAAPAVATIGMPTAPGAEVSRQNALSGAENLLAAAEVDLRRAVANARQVRLDTADGTLSATVPPQAGRAWVSLDLATRLLDPRNPTAVLNAAALTTPAPAPGSGRPTGAALTPRQALAAAAEEVRSAEAARASAQRLLRQIRHPELVGGPGEARLVRACAEAGATRGVCAPVPWGQHHLVFDSVVIGRIVHQRWPQIHRVGGWRPYDPYPDHPSGRAVDIMIPGWDGAAGRQLGDEIASYFQQHAEEFGIQYMIWRQRQWSATDRVGRWNGMSDRGSPTANHMDHVHLTVYGGKAKVFQRLLAQALTTA